MELEDARRCAEQACVLAIGGGLGCELGEATALLGMVAHAQGRWRELFVAQLCLAEFPLYGPDSHKGLSRSPAPC